MKELRFKIEQVALAPRNPRAALRLLKAMGIAGWVHDTVRARGWVNVPGEMAERTGENVADLSFNYSALDAANELEVLKYTEGDNWLAGRGPCVSHLGMHCDLPELRRWKAFFADRNIAIAQEVVTQSHTNPEIKDSRRYNYCIFNTHPILGVDVKFIVRLPYGDGA
jgi:hypothetical protein